MLDRLALRNRSSASPEINSHEAAGSGTGEALVKLSLSPANSNCVKSGRRWSGS